jgi:hypothetical protein
MAKPKRAESVLKLEDEHPFLESTADCLPVSGAYRDLGGGHKVVVHHACWQVQVDSLRSYTPRAKFMRWKR